MTAPPGSDPDGFVDVGPLEDFPDRAGRRVSVGEAAVAVFRDGSRLHALADRCPHAGAPLSDGRWIPCEDSPGGGEVVCSWHAWRFDPGSGRCTIVASAPPVPVHEARIEAGRVLIRLRTVGVA